MVTSIAYHYCSVTNGAETMTDLHWRGAIVCEALQYDPWLMRGDLVVYDPEKKLCYFETGAYTSELCIVFIGGLTDNFLSVPYMAAMTDLCTELGASLIQVQFSSANSGFGFSSLKQDADELQNFMRVRLQSHPRSRFLLFGHSTGCQDIVYYLKNVRKEGTPVIGGILQAGISDRDAFSLGNGLLNGVYLDLAAKMINEGAKDEFMPRKAELIPGFPITAYRYHSLMAVKGDDDFFSIDLPKEYQSQFFSGDVPLAVILSGKDRFFPPDADASLLAERYKQFPQIKLAEILPEADHNVDDVESQTRLIEFVRRAIRIFQQ